MAHRISFSNRLAMSCEKWKHFFLPFNFFRACNISETQEQRRGREEEKGKC